MRRGLGYALSGTLAAALLTGLVVGWSYFDKSVTVSVDDTVVKKIHTLSLDVRGALRDAGYPLGPHDRVTPGPGAALHDGTVIALARGRELDVDVDGTMHSVWVTESTVGSALSSLGYSSQDYASLAATDRLPLTPTLLAVRTVKSVTLVRAGVTTTVDSTAPSVGQLLADEGVSPGPQDRLSVPANTALSNGMMIVWQKVQHQIVVGNQTLGFDTVYRPDPARLKGTSIVTTAGETGTLAVTYDLMTVDGKPVSKAQTASSVIVEPVDEVVLVGTAQPKPTRAATPTTRPTTTATPVVAKPTTSPTSRPVTAAKPTSAAAPKPVVVATSKPVIVATPKPVPKPAPKPVHTVAPRPVVTTAPARAPLTAARPQPVVKPAPKPAPTPVAKPKPAPPITTIITVTPGSSQALARQMLPQWGWPDSQFSCLKTMWDRESGWRVDALNPSSGAYGIPQALPAEKMATAGADWRTNPKTQIHWGLDYIKGRYGSPCAAWAFWQGHNWY
jgi:resuscitation-promoting factor RpfB